ncbi:MAG: VTT domain-containing protein [Brevefilum sp.]|nr:VTT domain-containing protein [Brevefilum sp.]MDT8381374.1 VTT domain-containing protein [Brevefilum sp.]MDW7754625.1 VTT domain-containing protein [Brevefilum sp.]
MIHNNNISEESEISGPVSPKKKLSKQTLNIIRVIVLLAVIALTVFLVIKREEIQALKAYGYPGIFLFSILANATIFVPVPGVMFTSAMGAVFNPLFVSIAAGAGAALGELSGYMAGFSGQAVVEDSERYQRVVRWMEKYGDITILVLAFIPNPLFDLAGIIAGILKMPIWKFLIYCVIGKILKMMIFAYAGNCVMMTFERIF